MDGCPQIFTIKMSEDPYFKLTALVGKRNRLLVAERQDRTGMSVCSCTSSKFLKIKEILNKMTENRRKAYN